LGERGFEPL